MHVDDVYLDAVSDILWRGTLRPCRNEMLTQQLFSIRMRFDLADGFPLLTTKEMSWRNILFENLWFLSGNSSNEFFARHNIGFWKPWEDGNGNLPVAYGEYWRAYPDEEDTVYDQFASLLALLEQDRYSRRLVLTNWHAGSASRASLPPCHLMAVFNCAPGSDGVDRLNVHLTQRSGDMALGVPYNIAGYGFLLQLVSHLSRIPAGVLEHTIVDAHVYAGEKGKTESEYDHRPSLQKQLDRRPFPLPTLEIKGLQSLEDLDRLIASGSTEKILSTFQLRGYECHPAIKFRVMV